MRGEFKRELVDSLLKLREYIWNNFKVDEQTFMNALKQSANARGYLIGAISELKLRYSLATCGYHINRIPEKWEGEKRHFADFYVSEDGAVWYLLEVKGLKSNAEKWTKLYNLNSLVRFLSHKALRKPIAELLGLDGQLKKQKDKELKQKLVSWILDNFPKFDSEYREEIDSKDHAKIEERLHYLKEVGFAPLVTHLVSGAGTGKRLQATPRKDEFDILAVNLFLRVGEHKFVYANTQELPASKGKGGKDHLQQNYLIGIYFKEKVYLNDLWKKDFKSVFDSVKKKKPGIPKDNLNIDTRWLRDLGGKP